MFDYAVKTLIKKRDGLTNELDSLKLQIVRAEYTVSVLGMSIPDVSQEHVKDQYTKHLYDQVEEIYKAIKDINDALDALRQKNKEHQ